MLHTLNRIVTPSTYYATGRDEEGNLDFVRSTEGSDYMKLTRTNSGTRTINFEASANYDRLFGEKHRVGALFLFSMRNYTDNFPGNYVDALPTKTSVLPVELLIHITTVILLNLTSDTMALRISHLTNVLVSFPLLL